MLLRPSVWALVPLSVAGVCLTRPGMAATRDTPAAAEVRLRWLAVAGAVSYELELASDPAFAQVLLRTQTAVAGFLWRARPAGPVYWRVRGFDAAGRASPWSDVGRIEPKDPPPAPERAAPPPAAPSPATARARRAPVVPPAASVPARVAVSLTEPKASAGQPLRLRVQVWDERATLVPLRPLVTCSAGALSEPALSPNEELQVVWTAPRRVPPEPPRVRVAVAAGENDLVVEIPIEVRAGAPAHLAVREESTQWTRWSGTLVYAVTVTDVFGNPTAARLDARAKGARARIQATQPGEYRVIVAVERALKPVRSELVVSAGALSEAAEVLVAAREPAVSLHGGLGVISNLALVAPRAQLGVDWHGRAVGYGWRLGLWTQPYLSRAAGTTGVAAPETFRRTVLAVPWLVMFGWELDFPPVRLVPTMGGGVTVLSVQTSLQGHPSGSRLGVAATLEAGLVLEHRWGPGVVRGAALACWQGAASLPQVRGALGAVALQVGYGVGVW